MFENYLDYLKKNKLVFATLAVLVLTIGTIFILQKKPEAAMSDFPTISSTPVAEESEAMVEVESPSMENTKILVDVKGAVKNEGLYELDKSARVNDAIQAAGGFSDLADKKSVNLAKKLMDESVVYVASQGEEISVIRPASSSAGQDSNSDGIGKVNLNTASLAELTTISGIGEKRANDILTYRDSNGGFKTIDDLKNVPGIGDKTLENMRPYVTVD